MSPAGDDAQRELEQRALRNVRGLIDRLEGQEANERWSTRRFVVVIAIVAVVFAVAVASLIAFNKKPGETKSITLPPAQVPR